MCRAESIPEVLSASDIEGVFRWYSNGEEVVNGERFQISHTGLVSHIRVFPFTPVDTNITCSVSIQLRASGATSPPASAFFLPNLQCNFAFATRNFKLYCIHSCAAELQVLVPVLHESVGGNVIMSCEFVGYATPQDSQFQWWNDELQVEGGGRFAVTYSEGIDMGRGQSPLPSKVSLLTIMGAELSDEGNYTCSVLGTNNSATVELRIADKGD